MTTTLTTTKPVTWEVHYKSDWGDTWTYNSRLHPTSVNFMLASVGIQTATVIYDYGMINTLGVNREKVSPLNLAGKFIRITLNHLNSDAATDTTKWFGYCPTPADRIDGTLSIDGVDVPKGRTTFSCYGLEWFLKDTLILQSIITGDEVLENTISFNNSVYKRYDIVEGNRSTNVNGDGIYTFDPTPSDENEPEQNEWNGKNVIEHLLFNWSSQTGDFITWTIESGLLLQNPVTELANIKGVWDFAGKNYLDAIKEIISPTNAFTFKVDVDESSNKAVIKLFPSVDSDIDDGAETIVTANDLTVGLLLDSDVNIDTATVKHLDNVHYDQIEVRGGPLRVCFTISIVNGSFYTDSQLAEGWTPTTEVLYDLEPDDKSRATDDYDDVYTRFTMPIDWDGQSGGVFTIPGIDTDTGLVQDPVLPQTLFFKNKVFDRTLPWTEIDNERQPRRPFALYTGEDGLWRRIEKPVDDDLSPVGLKMLDDRLGIQLQTGSMPNHITALDQFAGATDVEPQWDVSNLLATVSMVTDEHTRIIVDAPTAEPGQLNRKKVINVPDLQLWYIAPGTVKSFDPNTQGEPGLTVSTEGEKYSRNDTDIMQRIALLASNLYGVKRQALDVVYKGATDDMFINDLLGYFVSEADTGETTQPINTIISKISYELNANSQTRSLSTDFFDIDVIKFGGGRKRGGFSGRSSSFTADEIANIPVRFGASGGGSSSTPFYWNVTKKKDTPGTVVVADNKYRLGKTMGTVADEDVVLPVGGGDGNHVYYIYFQALYETAYTLSIEISTSKPTQADDGTKRAWREEVCKINSTQAAGVNVVTKITPIWSGQVMALGGMIV